MLKDRFVAIVRKGDDLETKIGTFKSRGEAEHNLLSDSYDSYIVLNGSEVLKLFKQLMIELASDIVQEEL